MARMGIATAAPSFPPEVDADGDAVDSTEGPV